MFDFLSGVLATTMVLSIVEAVKRWRKERDWQELHQFAKKRHKELLEAQLEMICKVESKEIPNDGFHCCKCGKILEDMQYCFVDLKAYCTSCTEEIIRDLQSEIKVLRPLGPLPGGDR